MSREPGAWLRHLFSGVAAVVACVAKVAFFVVAGCYVAYLVGVNVFLSTALFEKVIDGAPETLDIHFDRGWSLRPGRVHAKNLSVRSRDGSVEWMLRVGEVQFDVSFLALARQRFAASHVRGSGGSFRLRSRLDPWEVSPGRVAGLPPIEGYPAVPVRPYSQCSANEWSDAHYHLWTIQLDDVHADDVRELWINRYRLDGNTSTSGRFYLKPVRAVEVGPLHAEVRGSELSVTGATWAQGVGAAADFTLPRFDPRAHGGKTLLQALSVGLDAHGVVPDVSRLPLPLPKDVQIRGAVDLRRLGVRFDEGRLRRGSHMDVVGPHIVVERGEHELSSALALTADIEASDERLAFHAVAGGARLARAGGAVVLAPRIDIAGFSARQVLDEQTSGLYVTVESADVELPDVRALAPYMRSASVTLAGGHARGQARAEVWPEESRAAGRASLQADDLDVTVAGVRASGGLEAKASLASFDWRTGRLERPEAVATVRSRLEIGQAQAAPQDKKFAADVQAVVLARGFDPQEQTIDVSGSGVAFRNMTVAGEPASSSHGDAALREATLRLGRLELRGVASADVTDATSLLASVRNHVPWPFRGLMDLPRLLASARISVDARRVEVREVEARGGVLVVHGVFAAGGDDRLGAFVVEGGPVSVGVRLDPGGSHVHLFGLSDWLEQEEQTVSQRFGGP